MERRVFVALDVTLILRVKECRVIFKTWICKFMQGVIIMIELRMNN